MTARPTADDLAAWRRLCDGATAGPWRDYDGPPAVAMQQARAGQVTYGTGGVVYATDPTISGRSDGKPCFVRAPFTRHDAAFIAAARTALPAMLDEVERARAVVAALVEALRQRAKCAACGGGGYQTGTYPPEPCDQCAYGSTLTDEERAALASAAQWSGEGMGNG